MLSLSLYRIEAMPMMLPPSRVETCLRDSRAISSSVHARRETRSDTEHQAVVICKKYIYLISRQNCYLQCTWLDLEYCCVLLRGKRSVNTSARILIFSRDHTYLIQELRKHCKKVPACHLRVILKCFHVIMVSEYHAVHVKHGLLGCT